MARRTQYNFKYFIKVFGNALLHIVLGISYLVPRQKDKWLVGNAKGFNNNTKYFFLHAKLELKKENCYWISKNRKSLAAVRRLGFKAYHPASPVGLYHLLTAGVYVYDIRISALNAWTYGCARRVNLWHGVGIKNVEHKISNAPREVPVLSYLRHPVNYIRPHLFLSTSPLMTTHFAECFRIPESRCVESSYPRCEVFHYSEERLQDFLRRIEGDEAVAFAERLRAHARVYIYMPTWRGGKKDFIRQAGFDLGRLEEALAATDSLFLFKLHPMTKISIDTAAYPHIVFLDNRMDIYPLLPFTDVLVTDYSSIYYDYLLMPEKEILLFPFDYQEYVTEDRDLAFDFDEYTPGERVYSFDELVQQIAAKAHFSLPQREWITQQFWGDAAHRRDLYQAVAQL
ncbi:MAG: CDP-glycerol glycerophosphotransferase family protein [Bacteroidaceae bacterium]|nr:CDP-glycerol glycerophosphotransferase family protein [Bacteroidaceae bacterium]